jgi:hypothetical protein
MRDRAGVVGAKGGLPRPHVRRQQRRDGGRPQAEHGGRDE